MKTFVSVTTSFANFHCRETMAGYDPLTKPSSPSSIRLSCESRTESRMGIPRDSLQPSADSFRTYCG